jgi:4-carboxymuconolactone decarboxylase
MREATMKDLHSILSTFTHDFPDVYRGHEALGKIIHEEAGPLPEKTRWLIKVAISGASGHDIALETHIAKAREAGATEDEITHTLLLIIQTAGFPAFMEAYSTYKTMT